MKLTKSQLKQIIKEELSTRLNEDYVDRWIPSASPLAKEMVNVTLGGDVDEAKLFWQKNFLSNNKDPGVFEAAKQVLARIAPHQVNQFLPKGEGGSPDWELTGNEIVRLAKRASRYPNGAGCADGSMERPCPDSGWKGAPQLENKMKLTKSQLKQIIKEELENINEKIRFKENP